MLAHFKRSLRQKRLVVAGVIHYIRHPDRGKGWGGPFNGQIFRRRMFLALMTLDPVAIVETGTFLGTTTECFGETGLSVITIEGHPKWYGFAKARLLRFDKVCVRLGDSRLQLRKLLAGMGPQRLGKPIFFYLDAHWENDLPLGEELEIILASCAEPIIMIDDFQVPGDPGYGFDKYANGKMLARDYIEPLIQREKLSLFYPAAASAEETGAKRGCAVLVRSAARARLLAMPELRPAEPALSQN